MSQRTAMSSRFWLLTDAVCAGTLTADEQTELNVLLAADPAARRCYLDYCQIHGELSFLLRASRATQRAMDQIDQVPYEHLAAQSPAPRSPLLGFLDSISARLPGGEFTVGALLLSCVAAAFYGLTTFVFKPGAESAPMVMSPGKPASGGGAARGNSAPGNQPATAFAHLVPRGGCVWAAGDPLAKVPAGEGSYLIAGQELRLVAGIADIEFASGTYVAIVGPTQLRLDSVALCQLKWGRLYAQVPQPAVGFTVATPAAEVIDLGTEFGVEVDESGRANVQVVKGRVEVVVEAPPGSKSEPARLVAGQTVRVDKGTAPAPSTGADAERLSEKFAALRPAEKSSGASSVLRLLAHYRLGEDDSEPKAQAGGAPLKTLPADNLPGCKPLDITGTPTYTNNVAAPGSKRAMRFGPDAVQLARGVGLPGAPPDNWVIDCWVRPQRIDTNNEFLNLVQVGSLAKRCGFGLTIRLGQWSGHFIDAAYMQWGAKCQLDRWTHLALVHERTQAFLYVDGKLAGNARFEQPKPADNELSFGSSAFKGDLDEVRIWELRGSFHPELLVKGSE